MLKRSGRQDPLLGQVLAGKYRIDEKIDEGGMGCVYRATHVLMEKVIAVKVLHPALAADEKIVARFTREAKAASRISHPHAINVTDFGESDNGVVYLVMEYLPGRTLKDVVRSGGPMTLQRVVEIVRQVAGALDTAHAEGVVHRDLKSDNIMLQEAADGSDWAKVLDFGIAKIQQTERSVHETDPGLTAPNIIIGTPQYMSPEQCAQASDIDARSDIYSFGIILFEMFVGHVPFTGDSPTVIMMKHLQDPPPSVLDERKDLPAEVGRVVARALAKRPEDRFQKVGELYEALAQAAEGESAASLAAAAAAVETDRIVQPTGPNEAPRTTVAEEPDESTVVTPRYTRSTTGESELPPPVAPLPEPSFNPWRIAVPAIALLAVVFAVFFAFQRDGGVDNAETPPLQADPNSQPVQTVTPPTGQAERNLVPSATAPQPGATIPSEVVGGAPGTAQPANANHAQPTPPPDGEGKKPEANQNTQPADDAEDDEDEDDAPPVPTPTPKPRRPPNINANQRVEPPPATAPTPKKVDEVKPEKPEKPEKPPDDQPQVAVPPSLL
ncbi:MAG TPA: serine/threonine-protein kinase [Pyrinomonadaceae bacterium]|nr:serine/threonine-protein kinase [Pyrinomonadaceae bacterium]